LGALALTLILTLSVTRELNVLLHSETAAQMLGIRVKSLRRRLHWIAAFATAAAVTTAGTVGFVGLIAPLQWPVGAIIALLGVPLFLWILLTAHH
jgi:ABC-type Fe3+-siderophore transport system permease subunit